MNSTTECCGVGAGNLYRDFRGVLQCDSCSWNELDDKPQDDEGANQ